jgi:ABC-type ATPase involved in cell division
MATRCCWPPERFENVAFGLRMQKTPAAEITPRVMDALKMVQLEAFAQRKPQAKGDVLEHRHMRKQGVALEYGINVAVFRRNMSDIAAEITPRVMDALKMVQLEAFAQRKPHQLSGGQQQRAMATRCCWPPESWCGLRWAKASSCTIFKASITRALIPYSKATPCFRI